MFLISEFLSKFFFFFYFVICYAHKYKSYCQKFAIKWTCDYNHYSNQQSCLHTENTLMALCSQRFFFFCHNLCTPNFNIAHTHHTICTDYHYIYMYITTISSIHSHIDANTLHIKHVCTPAITNAHIHTSQYLHVILITFTCWCPLHST